MVPHLAEISNVFVERNHVRLVDIPSLIIPSGENTVIFGPNGSGKSTLLKLLMRFYYPSATDSSNGTVKLLGSTEWNVWDLRQHLGLVSSEIDFHFTSGRSGRLTPLDAVLTGFESSELELGPEDVTPERLDKAREWLEFFEIDSQSSKHVGWLSTGERRRVMLARAMVLEPDALLLDEPTAGLDIVARSKLLRRLSAMCERGIQLILVTHHLEEVVPEIKRVVMLKSGRIFLEGLVKEAFTPERLSELFGLPIAIETFSSGQIARLA